MRSSFVVVLAAGLLFAVFPVCAQANEKFTNLKVLPKNISRQQLLQTMREFAFALNVRCDYCHAQGPDHDLDFASDKNDKKDIARVMMKMVDSINADYIEKAGMLPPTIHVQCVTCHRGLPQPQTLHAVLAGTIDSSGIDSAVAQYKQLRASLYGSGEYDFSERSLNHLAEELLDQQKNRQAAAIAELNFSENHPDSLWSYHVLAEAHLAAGEKAQAKSDFEKILSLHPEDGWAKQQLDSLGPIK